MRTTDAAVMEMCPEDRRLFLSELRRSLDDPDYQMPHDTAEQRDAFYGQWCGRLKAARR